MTSKYFEFKLKTENFESNLKKVVQELSNTKVLICADKKELKILDKKYKLLSSLNVSSLIFDNEKIQKKERFFDKIKVVNFEDIKDEVFDFVLITSEKSVEISKKLNTKYNVSVEIIKSLFVEVVKDEQKNLPYVLDKGFEKYFKNLKKKLKNKRVMIYGAGLFFRLLHEYFDFSDLNIIGVVDIKYRNCYEEKSFLGYKTFRPEDIVSENPDYLIIALKRFIPVFEGLYFNYLCKTKIKMVSLVKKTILGLLLEIDI